MISKKIVPSAVLVLSAIPGASALAAEQFQLRYNIAGSIGGEMFAEPNKSGILTGLAFTDIQASKVTGGNGKPIVVDTPGGTVPLPPTLPAALDPTYPANPVQVNAVGSERLWNLGLGYVTADDFAGGRLAYGINVSWGTKKQRASANPTTPGLNFNPATPAPVEAAVTSQFNTSYQGQVAAEANDEDGRVTQLGDTELQVGWVKATDQVRMVVGTSLIVPTGGYDAGPPSGFVGPSVGFGNFYTLRPSYQIAYLPIPEVAIAGKVTVGLNTRNKDNQLRSGDWYGLEAAIGYKTPIGPIGLHTVYVQQYQADSNNPFGSARLRSTNVGAFYTTKVPVVDAALTVQFMKTVDSQYSKSGNYAQIRMLKLF